MNITFFFVYIQRVFREEREYDFIFYEIAEIKSCWGPSTVLIFIFIIELVKID